ncbi:MAG: HEAT repeat domain-containing protein [Planctomycetota bacterium]
MLPLLLAVLLFLSSPPLPGHLGVPAPDKALDAATARLARAAAVGTEDEKREALAALVALGTAAAVPALEGEYARSSQELARTRDQERRDRTTLERKQDLLVLMALRAERDGSLAAAVDGLRTEIDELSAALERAAARRTELALWCEALGDATVELFGGLAPAARRKAEGEIWDDLLKHPELGVRIGAAELIGRIGGRGSAIRLLDHLDEVWAARSALGRQLPAAEAEVRAFERRLQAEAERQEGRTAQASIEQYERLKAAAAATRREMTRLAHLLDALAAASGRALSREEAKDLAKTLATLLRRRERAEDGLGLFFLDALRHASGTAVAATLHDLLAAAEDPLPRAAVIDALAAQGDRTVEGDLARIHLQDESWHVRSRAAAALAALRSRAAIPVLIERLAAEEGRVRTDIEAALRSLTGKAFGTNVEAWRDWWRAEGEGFVVPAEEPVAAKGLDAAEALGVTFFGIRTESQRVLFLLDVSGSMDFSMVPRDNPTDDPGRPFDLPRAGEDSRLDVAKRELVKALGGIHDGGRFDLVLYASDVWCWKGDLVEMSAAVRSDTLRFVAGVRAVGGTNIYGALARAFDIAGTKAGEEWCAPAVDTFFLLTDGRPSMGLVTDADAILAYVRERNRSAGIVLHAIGLSGAQDAYLLDSLAAQNGGVYAAR